MHNDPAVQRTSVSDVRTPFHAIVAAPASADRSVTWTGGFQRLGSSIGMTETGAKRPVFTPVKVR